MEPNSTRAERAGRSRASLDEKYAKLVQRYDALVKKYESSMRYAQAREERAQARLATARSALAQGEPLRRAGEVAFGTVHELSNSLTAIRLRVALLRRAGRPDVEREEHLSALGQIVDDSIETVARFRRLAPRQLSPADETIDLARVVDDCVALVRVELDHEAGTRGTPPIRIVLMLAEVPAVRASPTEIRHVLVNLLLNARDAMPRGGTVVVTLERLGAAVALSVADEGKGIPKEHLTKIFEPFFSTKGEKGTGLGLALASETLARLGATITAENRPSGGAVLSMRFPVAASMSGPPETITVLAGGELVPGLWSPRPEPRDLTVAARRAAPLRRG